MTIESEIITKIKDNIKSDYKLNKIFNHFNQKYSIEELLKYIIIILKTGISFREIAKHTSINWNTIYKFFIKLVKYNIIKDVYKAVTNNMKNPSSVIDKPNINFLYTWYNWLSID